MAGAEGSPHIHTSFLVIKTASWLELTALCEALVTSYKCEDQSWDLSTSNSRLCGSPPVIPAFEKRHGPRSQLAKQTSCIGELWVQGTEPASVYTVDSISRGGTFHKSTQGLPAMRGPADGQRKPRVFISSCIFKVCSRGLVDWNDEFLGGILPFLSAASGP